MRSDDCIHVKSWLHSVDLLIPEPGKGDWRISVLGGQPVSPNKFSTRPFLKKYMQLYTHVHINTQIYSGNSS